jgi:Ca2+-binding RTX toxin-like protein
LCRGCSWDYSPAETDYAKVDAIEIATGPAGLQDVPTQPGPSPFTPLAINFYEQGIDAGGTNANKIAAVGGSDSHNAGTRDDPVTQSPIGQPTTVVHAPELSEKGIQQGVEARHTYVKMWGQSGPDLRLEGSGADSGDPPAIMGDTLEADAATFTARVSNLDAARAVRPGLYTLVVLRNGLPLVAVPILTGDEFEFEFPGLGPGRYGIEVIRPGVGVASIEAYSTPIWLEPEDGGSPPPPSPPDDCATPLVGTSGDDTFTGTEAGDDFRGGGGSDRIDGGPGDDCLRGGRGADRIRGGAGEDIIYGNRGADRVKAVDREADVVRCGRSRRDRARADAVDDVRGCERVRPVPD